MAAVYGNALHTVAASTQYGWVLRVSSATNNFTIAFWIRVAALPAATQTIVMNGDLNNHEGYRLNLDSAGKITLDMIFVNGSCKTSTALSTATWTHIICERDTGTSTLYINATANGATSASTPNGINTDADTIVAAAGTKGAPSGAAPTSIVIPLDADLDEMRFYDRALTSGERTSLYNYGVDVNNGDISATSLMARWKFDESSGNPQDSSGNSKHLTAVGTPTFVTGIQMISNSASSVTGFMRPGFFWGNA